MKIVNNKSVEYLQYVVLLVVLFLASHLFLSLVQSLYKFYVILITALFYIIWGVWHHRHMDRLDRILVLEYVLVALIVVALSAMGLGIVRFI